ncbi:MAG: alpha-amylase family glycosyl hydrolase [Planctomycetia bacterium]
MVAAPILYQLFARWWLRDVGRALGRPATFADVPDAELDRLVGQGVSKVYITGVWKTGRLGRDVARSHEGLRRDFAAALPDFTDDDVVGSSFAVEEYVVHPDFGGDAALAALRERLADRGLSLILDFVPNHVALDHRWPVEHPEWFVAAHDDDADGRIVATAVGPRRLAFGRDPNFPPWTDTLQLNYRHPGLRQAMVEQLHRIAGRCDGVRCDMAMLLLPEVFQRTWGDRALPGDGVAPDDAPFWPVATSTIKRAHSEFTFMAEAYWDTEYTLQQQGFDYCYDKRLYDRLHDRDPGAVRGHLSGAFDYQTGLARFLENHDEPRAAAVFPLDVHRAAAVATYLTPGLKFFFEGQTAGRKVRTPIQLRRQPEEPFDAVVSAFYDRLRSVLQHPAMIDGTWRLLDCVPAWPGNPTADAFFAWTWERKEGESWHRLLVAARYGGDWGQCFVRLPLADLAGRKFILTDWLTHARYERDGTDLAARGLYLDVPGWHCHAFDMREA